MSPHPVDATQPAADPTRLRAAALFDAAARSSRPLDPGARLHCLAAVLTLNATPPPGATALSLRRGHDSTDPAALVRAALQVLGSMPLDEFAARDIRDAAEHGRRALRRLL